MTSALDLLKSLGVRNVPSAGHSTSSPALKNIGGMSFADLLSKASGGEFSSGQSVTVAKDADVQLTDEQLSRMAKIADAAETQGANRVLVLMDGQAFKLDVAVRQVTGAADVTGVVTGVDAVVAAPISGAPAQVAPGKPLGSLRSSNASLIDTLAAMGR